jgi:hypothetical protein
MPYGGLYRYQVYGEMGKKSHAWSGVKTEMVTTELLRMMQTWFLFLGGLGDLPHERGLQLSLLRLGFTALVCYCVVRGLYEVFGGKGEFNRSGQTGSSPPLRCIWRSAHRAGKEGSLTKLVSRQVCDLVALQ